jgi:hypothetical protein
MKGKNFLMAVGCMLAVGLLVVASANAEWVTHAESGFNNSSGIADPSPLSLGDLHGQGGTGLGWLTPWRDYRREGVFTDGTTTVENTVYDEGDQAILTHGTGPTTAGTCAVGRICETPYSTTNEILFEYSVCVDNLATNETAGVYVMDCDDDGNDVFDVDDANFVLGIIGIGHNGGVKYNGASTRWGTGTISMGTGTWYHFDVLFDMDTKKVLITLDGVDDNAWRSFYHADSEKLTGFFCGGTGDTYYDEVRISVVPEPSTLLLLGLAMVGVLAGRGRRF